MPKSLIGTYGFSEAAGPRGAFGFDRSTRGRFDGGGDALVAFRLRVKRSGAERGRCEGLSAERSMAGAVIGVSIRITFLAGLAGGGAVLLFCGRDFSGDGT
jgi:hypothetical protein